MTELDPKKVKLTLVEIKELFNLSLSALDKLCNAILDLETDLEMNMPEVEEVKPEKKKAVKKPKQKKTETKTETESETKTKTKKKGVRFEKAKPYPELEESKLAGYKFNDVSENILDYEILDS